MLQRTNSANRAIAFVATAALSVTCLAQTIAAAEPEDYLGRQPHHKPFTGDLPPGVIGTARAMGRGPVQGYFQPVMFSGPSGMRFSLPNGGTFGESDTSLMAGLLIGSVYRFQITGIPGFEGEELYPTIELIDRTYPPPGLATQFPIPINLDMEDIQAAMEGQLVTRIVYLEDPQTALPLAEKPTTSRAVDVAQYQDPLEVADRLGRPVAIVRIGSLLPPSAPELMPQFYFGYPAWAPIFKPEPVNATPVTTQP